MIFFSFVAAPSVFKVLPVADAGKVVASIFTKYYWVGFVCGPVALVTSLFSGAAGAGLGALKIILLVVMVIAFFYAGLWIRPRIASLKQEIAETTDHSIVADMKGRFDKAHRASVRFNMLVMGCGVIVVLITATSLRP